MRKLKLPVLVENKDLPQAMSQKDFEKMFAERHYEFVPVFYLTVPELCVVSDVDFDDEGYYVYSYIFAGKDRYYEHALVRTDDFRFKTYAEWKHAVNAMAAQLVKHWKDFVRGMYKEEGK